MGTERWVRRSTPRSRKSSIPAPRLPGSTERSLVAGWEIASVVRRRLAERLLCTDSGRVGSRAWAFSLLTDEAIHGFAEEDQIPVEERHGYPWRRLRRS